MSLVRFAEDGSDVYVYVNFQGEYECCGCCQVGRTVCYGSTKEILNHLLVHRERGDYVPLRVLDELRAEEVGRETRGC